MTIVSEPRDNVTRRDISPFVTLSPNRQISVRMRDKRDISLRDVTLSRPDALSNECLKHKLNQSDDALVKLSANDGLRSVSANEWVLIALSRLRGTQTPICDALQNFSKMESSNG